MVAASLRKVGTGQVSSMTGYEKSTLKGQSVSEVKMGRG